jgi:O-antigen/teichoic acid export membrane protein
MGVSFYTFTPLLVLIISSIDFLGVIDIIPMMLVGILLDSYSITLSWPYFFKKEVKAESIRSIFATSISIILLFFLIPAFGIIGAATIYLINQALRMIFIYKKSQKFYQYDFLLLKKISMIFLILLIEIILYLIFSFLSNNFVIISSLISLIIIIIIIFNFRKSLINITKNVSHFINSSHFS